jgi:hypothetical protein
MRLARHADTPTRPYVDPCPPAAQIQLQASLRDADPYERPTRRQIAGLLSRVPAGRSKTAAEFSGPAGEFCCFTCIADKSLKICQRCRLLTVLPELGSLFPICDTPTPLGNANHTVPYGTALLGGDAFPGTSCQATIAPSLRDISQ